MFGFFRRRDKGAESVATPENEAESGLIGGCRELIGPTPRSLDGREADACRLELSPDLAALLTQSKDQLLRIIADQKALRDRGQVVWGHLVQANKILFEPDNTLTLPANVVYSLDPYFDGRVAQLATIARGLFARKGSVPGERELREFVRVITDERERIMRRELPRTYCGGHSVYFTSCFIQPGHLPGNCLLQSAFPMLVNYKETEAVMLLPSRFWPKPLVSQWLQTRI
ncbi:hypothetical protein [Zavarzinella formosa]|uniref:hypothetical protein n=1 Tax=Zavarzinella formosa TaxID=360055 RepID=UPI0002F5C8C0|nr:hypothetical protein [Zavarzinella formosa]